LGNKPSFQLTTHDTASLCITTSTVCIGDANGFVDGYLQTAAGVCQRRDFDRLCSPDPSCFTYERFYSKFFLLKGLYSKLCARL
jgi:hypothetical protein